MEDSAIEVIREVLDPRVSARLIAKIESGEVTVVHDGGAADLYRRGREVGTVHMPSAADPFGDVEFFDFFEEEL